MGLARRPAPPSTAAPPPSSHPASSPRPAPTIPKGVEGVVVVPISLRYFPADPIAHDHVARLSSVAASTSRLTSISSAQPSIPRRSPPRPPSASPGHQRRRPLLRQPPPQPVQWEVFGLPHH
uniref:Uncharacterized protein n=1 Tax=Oryza nivara TaxID=4536 RepID=A0A0E0J619_ORYNI